MGFDPADVKHLQLAKQQGLGIMDLEEITIKGLKLEDVETTFKRPSTFS